MNASPEKQALLAIRKLRERVADLEHERHQPIAIVGMGCRFPGGASSPAAFWRLLSEGVDAVREVPPERWPRPSITGPHRRGELRAALLDNVDLFDAAFFGISPREAISLDPQQRLLLEVVWEALEHAAIVPARLERQAVGVFVGASTHDYFTNRYVGGLGDVDAYVATGGSASFLAGRVSYTLGLQGPAITVDTACSSSLVAVHLACQSLRNDECSLAIAGGVNLILSPLTMRIAGGLQALSPEGRCRTFDAGANGFVRGEGCGVVVLKRLADAETQRDTICAVIRGTSVNQDGRSAGITAPNVLAQQALIAQTLARSGISPETVGYIEAHGTGTPLGDPVEIESLRAVLGVARGGDDGQCALGSVKTNIGHLESAAGIAGLLKAVAILEHEEIPPHLHFRTLNPRISFEGTHFVIPGERRPWKRGRTPRLASVSSFGVSGTNAHLLLQEGQPAVTPGAGDAERESVLMVSSKTVEGLRAQAARYAEHLRAQGEQALEDVCYTAGAGRTAFAERAAVVGHTHAELAEALEAVARGDERPEVSVGGAREDGRGKLAFVFPGQGSQWVGMGRELWRKAPAFQATLEACDAAVRAETGWSVVEALTEWEAARLEAVDVVQPLLWAMGVSLAAEWRALGVEPDAVVGHSLGEVTAATVAGMLSVEDGAGVICRRSRLVKRLGGRGAMAVVELGEAEAEQAARSAGGGVEVAVINSRRSTVVSGRRPAVEALVRELEQQGVFCRFVKVDYASHSAEVETLRGDLGAALAEVRPQLGRVPLYSTVTGEVEDGHGCDAAYWVRNLRQRVRFADVMDRLLGDGYGQFVEVSPHPVLVSAMVEVVGAQGVMTGSLRREQGERRALLEALGRLAVHGHAVDWERLYPGARRLEMPTYAWQRERYWVEEAASAEEDGGDAGHPLLGRSVISSLDAGTRLWQRRLGGERVAYLQDHRVADTPVMPAAGYLELGLAAGMATMSGAEIVELSDVRFEQALGLPAEGGPCVQTALSEEGLGRYGFRVSSEWGEGEKRGWTVHASGRVRVGEAAGWATPESLQEVRRRCAAELSAEAFYKAVSAQGLEYRAAFQSVAEVWRGDKEAIASVRLPEGVNEADRYVVHPALLDGCLQVIAAAAGDGVGNGRGTWMPVGVERVRVRRRGVADGWCHARWEGDGEAGRGDVVLYDETGTAWGEIRGVRLQEVGRGERKPEDQWWLSEAWEPCEQVGERAQPAGRWAVVAEAGAWTEAVAEALQERGGEVERLASDGGVGSLAARLEEGGGRWRGVLHLAGGGSEAEVPQQVQQACMRALTLVQALGRMTWRDAPRLWLVTRGVQPVEGRGASGGAGGGGALGAGTGHCTGASRVALHAGRRGTARTQRGSGGAGRGGAGRRARGRNRSAFRCPPGESSG